MTMNRDGRDDGLDLFFEAARAEPEPGSEVLMARILGDALRVQDLRVQEEAATRRVAAPGAPARGLLSALWEAVGGWPAVGGLATAAVAGLWIGFSPALGVGDAVFAALGGDSAESELGVFLTGFEYALEEGETG